MLAERLACPVLLRPVRPYLLDYTKTLVYSQPRVRKFGRRRVGLRHKWWHSKNTANNAGVHAEKHATKACLLKYQLQIKWLICARATSLTDRASQRINPPPINLLGISSHRLIVDDLLKKPRHVDGVALRSTRQRRVMVKTEPAICKIGQR